MRVDGELPPLAGVQAVMPHNGATQLMLAGDANPQDVLLQLMQNHSTVEQFEVAMPTLDEIFIRAVSEQ